MKVNSQGYLQGRGGRTIFVIRFSDSINTSTGLLNVYQIHFPKHLIGRRVKIRVEFIPEVLNDW